VAHLKVVIIGGGVIGLSAAYHLAAAGQAEVTLIEKDAVGGGSSRRAAGITTGLLWSETGVRARRVGIEWFKRLSRELPDYTYHDELGCLNLFDPRSWPQRRTSLSLYDRLGARYEVLTAREINRRWPALTPPADFIGLHDPDGGYSEPDEYVAALEQRVRALGVRVVEGERVEEILSAAGEVRAVRTTGRRFEADAVISGIHSWSLLLWERLGLRLPIKSFVHQRHLSAPLPHRLVAPPVNADAYLGYLRPARGGRVLLGAETPCAPQFDVDRPDFHMDELSAAPGVRDQAVQRLSALAVALQSTTWESEHIGLIAFSMDGEPILGPVKELPGLFIAGAFHSGGFSYNTVAGLLLAEMVMGERPSVDVTAFSPDRFDALATEGYLAAPKVQADAARRRH